MQQAFAGMPDRCGGAWVLRHSAQGRAAVALGDAAASAAYAAAALLLLGAAIPQPPAPPLCLIISTAHPLADLSPCPRDITVEFWARTPASTQRNATPDTFSEFFSFAAYVKEEGAHRNVGMNEHACICLCR